MTTQGKSLQSSDIRQLLQAGDLLARLGRPASKLALLDRIVAEADTWPYQKLRLETALALRDLDAAERILRDIDSRDRPDLHNVDWLESHRRRIVNRPAVISRLQAEIDIRRPRVDPPVADRIVYVLNHSLPHSSSGYATRSHGMARGLQAVGYDVICLTRPGFPHDTQAPDAAAPAMQDIVEGVRYDRIASPTYRSHAGNGYIFHAATAIEERLRELRPEVVIAASNHLTSLPAQIAAARLGIPFIYEVRGFWEITRASREPEFMLTDAFQSHVQLESISARAADHVFTLTGAMRDELIARGVSGDKISLLPNSCDPDDFIPRPRNRTLAAALGISDDVPVIGYIGSFVQYEGLDDLVQAAALLKQRGVAFRLLLVGSEGAAGQDKGAVTSAIETAALQGGLNDWLIMPGRVPHDQVASYYTLIDIAPFPRKPQPVTEMVSPLKPLEAMAMQKAVVASSVRALAELLRDGETGIVFEKGNIAALTEALHRLVTDHALRHQLGVAGRAWVEQERTWPIMASKARKIITQMTGTHRISALESDV